MAWRYLSVLLVVLVFPAQALELTGKAEQGGILVGRTSPGNAVTLDDRAVPVDRDGRFLLGFAREAAPSAVLAVAGTRHEIAIAPRDWDIQRIDGLPQAKVTPDFAALARIKDEAALVASKRAIVSPNALFVSGLIEPAEGRISGVFGSQRVLNGEPRSPHSGVDIAAPTGTPVRSVADGVVSLAHDDLYFTGLTVMIDHGLGLQTVYAHLSRMDVAEGETVSAGQIIGAIGASGRATGPHLHWGATWLDVRLDPATVMAVLGRP